jgi:hypothetical protein
VEDGRPIAPGETRKIKITVTNTKWETEKLSSLFGQDSRFTGQLSFINNVGKAYVVPLDAAPQPSAEALAATAQREINARLQRENTPRPKIVGSQTFREGQLVFFKLFFTDPSNTATGFGFRGAKGSPWAEENHPFSSPSYGRVARPTSTSQGRIAYPFNLGCGTGSQYESNVEAWIYDRAGQRSPSITVHLACAN